MNNDEPQEDQQPTEEDGLLHNIATGLKAMFVIAVIRGVCGFNEAVAKALRGSDAPPSPAPTLDDVLKTLKEIQRRLKD